MARKQASTTVQATSAPAPATTPAAPAPACTVGLLEGRKVLQAATLGTVQAAPNVLARAGKLSNLPAPLHGKELKAGKPCKVRVPYTLAAWERVQAELAQAGGKAPADKLAAVSTGDFVQYAVRRGWLAVA